MKTQNSVVARATALAQASKSNMSKFLVFALMLLALCQVKVSAALSDIVDIDAALGTVTFDPSVVITVIAVFIATAVGGGLLIGVGLWGSKRVWRIIKSFGGG